MHQTWALTKNQLPHNKNSIESDENKTMKVSCDKIRKSTGVTVGIEFALKKNIARKEDSR